MQRARIENLTVDGVEVRYAVAGEGPAVLLVHGLATSMITWYCNIDALADAGFTAVAIDLPGYGDSALAMHLDYTPRTAARFLADFTTQLGLERFSVVGNSAGGLIAGLTALEYPDRVEKLALVGPAGLGAAAVVAFAFNIRSRSRRTGVPAPDDRQDRRSPAVVLPPARFPGRHPAGNAAGALSPPFA